MKWKDLTLKAKWALIMMLAAIFPALAGITIAEGVFGASVPLFVYALPAIWIILFLISLVRLRAGLVGGIIWGIMTLFIPIFPILKGIKNPIAEALGLPVCPFIIIGVIISGVVIYLCVKAYYESEATVA
jgi:hypothetical protein